jgi:Domain of unknown function (DUF4350)
MPLKLNPKDRKLLLGGAILFVLIVIGALLFGSEAENIDVPTTYSTGSGGAKAAYLLLQQSGYNVQRWERPMAELPDASGKVLVIAEPAEAPSRAERERLEKFISDGGHVVATGMFAGIFLPEGGSVPDPVAGMTWKKLSARVPTAITRAAPEITLAPQAFWISQKMAVPLYGDGDKVMVVRYPYGKGEVLWWASATPLTNAGLKEPGNMEFFLACLGGRQNQILWDEYIHGYRQSLAASVAHSQVKWLFLQLVILSLAVLLTFSRRGGPIFPAVAEVRLSPLEFVMTLGGLYQRAGAASVAVDVSYQRFRYWLTRRLALASNAPADEIERAVRDRWKFPDEDFAATLRACESARYHSELSEREALQLVQKIHSYAVKLKLFPSKEKH